MSDNTAKKAAISGLVFSGLSALFFVAMVVAVQWGQSRSPSQKDWGAVFGVAFGVPCLFFLVAACGSFLVSAMRALRKLFWDSREPSTSESNVLFRVTSLARRHPAIITVAGLATLIAAARIGRGALFLVGIPALLVTCGVAGGARLPSKVSFSDIILYVGVSVAIVVGILVYALHHH